MTAVWWIAAAVVVAAVVVGWLAWELDHAPLGCDDCQGTDPWCTCHIHITSESYPRRWPHP